MRRLRFVIFGSALMIVGVLGIISFGINDYTVVRFIKVFIDNLEFATVAIYAFAGFSLANFLAGLFLAGYGTFAKHE